jgi:hypothetical protein
MSNGTEENRQVQTDTRDVRPNGLDTIECPSWCIYPGECRGDHVGKEWGTVATGELPPYVGGPEAPTYNTAVVRAQHPESDDLAPGVALSECSGTVTGRSTCGSGRPASCWKD